jgi:DNA-binding IclR family transcriptional regulator
MTKDRAWNAKPERNLEIFRLRKAGWTLEKLARTFNISATRVYGLLHSLDWQDLWTKC